MLFSRMKNATAVIWKVLMAAQKGFKKIAAPELLAGLAEGAVYINGVKLKKAEQEAAA